MAIYCRTCGFTSSLWLVDGFNSRIGHTDLLSGQPLNQLVSNLSTTSFVNSDDGEYQCIFIEGFNALLISIRISSGEY